MGHAERLNQQDRAAAELEQARVRGLPVEPNGPPAGLAPSPFLVEIVRQRLVQCNLSAAGIRHALTTPNLSLQGRPNIDFAATTLMNLALLLDAQAATMDMLLSFLAGQGVLRPVEQPKPRES